MQFVYHFASGLLSFSLAAAALLAMPSVSKLAAQELYAQVDAYNTVVRHASDVVPLCVWVGVAHVTRWGLADTAAVTGGI